MRLLILPALLMAGCAAVLPAITPHEATVACVGPFGSGRWQFTHTVAIDVAGRARGALVGVIEVDSAKRFIHCVLMTVEGMVLFEATNSNGLDVIRALPPFSGDAYASGLMDDVQLLFLAPDAPPSVTGRTHDHRVACRYLQDDGAHTIDVMGGDSAGWVIRRYNRSNRLEKEVVAASGSHKYPAIPRQLTLIDHGVTGYTLSMHLIDARRPVSDASAVDAP